MKLTISKEYRNLIEREIAEIYQKIKPQIVERIEEFLSIWNHGGDLDLFRELVFCLLTPSSRAHSASRALEKLCNTHLLLRGTESEIAAELNIVRFRYKKASYIVKARDRFLDGDGISLKSILSEYISVGERRKWLASTVKGIGFKEASHFLRNIGLDMEIAILDRHILNNLFILGIIDQIPDHLSGKRYREIEKRMFEYARVINIPVSHLDFVFWYRGTGDVFK